MKLLGENIGQKLHDIGLGSDFMDMTPKAQVTRNKNRETRLHKNLKILYIGRHYE